MLQHLASETIMEISKWLKSGAYGLSSEYIPLASKWLESEAHGLSSEYIPSDSVNRAIAPPKYGVQFGAAIFECMDVCIRGQW